jgi:hypothetical protein
MKKFRFFWVPPRTSELNMQMKYDGKSIIHYYIYSVSQVTIYFSRYRISSHVKSSLNLQMEHFLDHPSIEY